MALSRRRLLMALCAAPVVGGVIAFMQCSFAALRPTRLNTATARTITAIVDRLIPAGDLPGAVALGIDERIIADSTLWQPVVAGVKWLDAYARRIGAANFCALDEATQLTALRVAWARRDSEAEQMLSALWHRSATLYYSEAVVQEAFSYAAPPQPTGFPNYHQAP